MPLNSLTSLTKVCMRSCCPSQDCLCQVSADLQSFQGQLLPAPAVTFVANVVVSVVSQIRCNFPGLCSLTLLQTAGVHRGREKRGRTGRLARLGWLASMEPGVGPRRTRQDGFAAIEPGVGPRRAHTGWVSSDGAWSGTTEGPQGWSPSCTIRGSGSRSSTQVAQRGGSRLKGN